MNLKGRLLSIFDNLVANIIVYFLIIAVPVIIGVFLNFEAQTILLIVLLVAQAFALLLLFSIKKTASQANKGRELLVRNADTDQVYLVDQYGLPRPIIDENTALYFADVFGYPVNEIPSVTGSSLIPAGPEVVPLRRWSPPRTIEDEMSAEANRSLKFLKKYPRTEGGHTIISFCLRNDGDHTIQINSAKLFFDANAPLSLGDISSKNKPMIVGSLECRLLFNGTSESSQVPTQGECQMDLLLSRKVSAPEGLISVRLGYVQITGFFRDTQIKFHLYV